MTSEAPPSIQIDPTDFVAYQYLAPLYAGAGRTAEAERADALYKQWRDDPLAARVGSRFFAQHPQWADEHISSHTHDLNSTARPVVIGRQAATLD